MRHRRYAPLAILTAALLAAVGASALPGISPEVQQCDGSYAAGPNTHAPYTMPIHVNALVQDVTGLRVGSPTRMGLVANSTLALWRFDSAKTNVTVTGSCVTSGACTNGHCWTFDYTYADETHSSTMTIGSCTYGSPSCVNGSTVVAVTSSLLPVGKSASPCQAPGTALTAGSTMIPGFFPADAHFADAGNAIGTFNGVQYGSVTYNTPTGNWDLPATYTLSAWFKTASASTQAIVSEIGPQGSWELGLSNSNGVRLLDSRDGAGGDANAPALAGVNLHDGGWHQIHVVRINGTSTGRRYYIDGKLVATGVAVSSDSFAYHPIAHPVMIGKTESGTEFFTGSIDEIRILDSALSDDDILMEYVGTMHKFALDGVNFSTAAGSYNPAATNGSVGIETYYPAETPTASSTATWVFYAQSIKSATGYTSQFKVIVDPSKPTAPGLSPTPTTLNDISWSWSTPSKICVSPGTPAPGPYYQLADCAAGAAITPPSAVFEPTRLIAENYAGAPNQIECRRLLLTDVWGTSPLSAPTSAYTLAAAPSAVAFSSVTISTGGFVVSWNTNSNPSYTRYEITYALDPGFTVGYATRAAVADDYRASSVPVTGLLSGTTYYVRVRAYSGRSADPYGGLTTAFATGSVVTDPPAPTLTGAPQSNASILWSWTQASGATGYTLLDSPTQTQLYAGGGLSKLVSGLAVNTRYDAEVQADMPTPTPPSARGRTFSYTLANAPTGLAAAVLYHSSATFTWNAAGNPAGTYYELVVATEPTFGVVVATLSVAGTTVTATNLFPGATYYAHVHAFNGLQVPTAFEPPLPGALMTATAPDPLTSVSPTPATPYIPSSGLVGSWQFDEGSGLFTADGSGYANPGNLVCLQNGCTSTPTFAGGPPGLGTAASFAALSGAVLTSSGTPFSALGSLTVEAWVYPQSTAQIADAGIAAIGKQTAEDFALDVSPTGSYRFLTASGGTDYAATVATSAIAAGQWAHVVGVYDSAGSGTSKLYVNGVLAAAVNPVPAHAHSGQVLAIGNRQNASGSYVLPFYGRVDSVRILGRALTAAEVLADYNGGFVSSVTAPAPNTGVIVALPPNAFVAPANIYISADPLNHPIRVLVSALNAGLAAPPAGLTLVPNSLIEVVPVVGGASYTSTLGSSATLTVPYNDSNGDNIIDGTNPPLAASAMQMYTLNTTVNRWELLPTSVDRTGRRASGVTPHFSVFALFAPTTIGSSLSGVTVYPVPWKPGSGGKFDGPGVSFAHLPASGRIRILSLSGRRVREFTYDASGAGVAVWNGLNDDGRRTASGVYFAKIESDADRSVVLLKFAIER